MKEPTQIAPAEHLHDIIKTSTLSPTISRGGSSVDVQICRRGSSAWSFIVVNTNGTSIHSTEVFENEQEALSAFEADLEQNGIDSYDDDAPTTCPLCRARSL